MDQYLKDSRVQNRTTEAIIKRLRGERECFRLWAVGCGLWEDAPFLLITEWVRFVKFINRLRSSSSCTAWLTDWLLTRGAWGHDGSLRYNKKPPWALTFSGTPMRFSIYTAKTVLSSSPPTATCLHSLSCPLLTANALPFSALSTQYSALFHAATVDNS